MSQSIETISKDLEKARQDLILERRMTIDAFKIVSNGDDPRLIGHPNGGEFGDAFREALNSYADRHMKEIQRKLSDPQDEKLSIINSLIDETQFRLWPNIIPKGTQWKAKDGTIIRLEYARGKVVLSVIPPNGEGVTSVYATPETLAKVLLNYLF